MTLPILQASITPASLSVTGLTANNKVYDGTTAASLSGTAALLGSICTGDVVSLSGTPTGNFDNKHVGSGKSVTVSGLSLTGADADNYTLTLPILQASITPASLNVTGLTANNKVYDCSTAATLSGSATLTGVVAGDDVTLSGTPSGAFADKNVGSNKSVAVTGLSISGADAGNYTLTLPILQA
ncbi:MAG: YDG domain-containing protein, partial [Polyangiaceae bacterium]|nr:YDG domain-containing protein [Polyangiaceae bacterium]